MSVIFPPAFLRPEMAAPILWLLGLFVSFCWKTRVPIKFLLLGVGVGRLVLFLGGKGVGGSANSIFMGARGFS